MIEYIYTHKKKYRICSHRFFFLLWYFFFFFSLFRRAMTDEKHKLKRSPTLSISSVPKPKEKKIPLPEMDTSEEEKEFKGLPGPAPTVSAGYIQTLVLHPTTERDPDRTGRHYAPCPPPTTTDISKDHAINEWVLNHLPLTEPQKQELIHNMNIERRKNEMLSESLTMRSKNLKALKEKETEKIRLEEEKERGHRLGVKELRTTRSCYSSHCS